MAFDALRRPGFPFAAATDEDYSAAAFFDAVEPQDRPRAEGLANRAVCDGRSWDELEGTFAAAAMAHYNDFGHSLIYTLKSRQLVEQLGDGVLPQLLPCLARHLSYTTREDLIPEFREYAAALAAIEDVEAGSGDVADSVQPALFGASTREALRMVVENYSRCRPQALYAALLEPLALNLLHFDTSYQDAYDRQVSDNVGWLDFTHGVTFANAVRRLSERHEQLWKQGLLQMALFVGRNRAYLDKDLDAAGWQVANRDAFFAEIHDRILDHGLRDPIFSAHLVKTAVAVEEEVPLAPPACQAALTAALNRFFHSPLKQKHPRRLARQAIDLVRRDFE